MGLMWRRGDVMRSANVGMEERGGGSSDIGDRGCVGEYLGWSGKRPEVRLKVQLLSGEEEAW